MAARCATCTDTCPLQREGAGAAPQKSWYESERERYMQAFQEDQKYWRENGEAIRRQAKEDQERQIKEMKLSAWG